MSIYTGRFESGAFIPDNPRYHAAIAKLNGRRGSVELLAEKKKRSLNENNYYWGVVIEILSEYTGYTPQEMHDALRFKFLRDKSERDLLPRMKSTAGLTTDEFEDYLSQIRIWAAQDLACPIPLPNEAA